MSRVNTPQYQPLRVATFAEFTEKWVREIVPMMKPSTQSSTKSQLRTRLRFFNDFALRDIQLSLVQSFMSGLKDSPKTIRNLAMTLRSIWNSARKQGYVFHDPFDGLVLPRLNKPEQRFFTADEMARIIAAAQEPYRTFYWLAAESGLRAGELCGLRWCDVNENSVRVRQSVWRGKVQSTKTANAVRAFAISPDLGSHLGLMRVGRDSLGFVFQTSRGTPWDANLVAKRKLVPLLRSLGIPQAGLHAFRHGCETVMDGYGTPVAVRLSRLGHGDTRMMVNYSHVISADDRRVAEEFGRAFAPKCAENQKRLQESPPVTSTLQ
jgi:integrase